MSSSVYQLQTVCVCVCVVGVSVCVCVCVCVNKADFMPACIYKFMGS